MSDDLRGRIAKAIWASQAPEGLREIAHPDCYDMADEVIADLGLTTEEREAQEPTPVRRFGRAEWDNREVTLYRVVGRWEER